MATELLGAVLGWLADNADRLLLTAVVLGGLVGLKQLVNRWRNDREVSSKLALSLSAVLVVLLASGLLVLVAVWELDEPLLTAYDGAELGTQIANILLSIMILGGGYALSDFLGHVIKDLAHEQQAISEHEREILHRVMQVTIYTFALLVVVGLFTDNIGSLLVGAGFLGIIVGMAARQTLGAVLAGFVIMFSKPFEVGDWVDIGDDEGTVTEITIVNTRIQSFDGEYVVVPNDLVSSEPVINRTRRGRLRLEIEVGVDYHTDPDEASEIAVEAVESVERLLAVPNPQAVTKEFGDSAVILGIRGWIDNPSSRKRWQARTEMIAAIKQAFADNDIKIPFPQQELSGRAETGGLRVVESSQPTAPRRVGRSAGHAPNSEPSTATPENGSTESTGPDPTDQRSDND